MVEIKRTDYRAIQTVLDTQLNALANNALSGLSSAIDNSSAGSNPDQDLFADFELGVTFGSAPTANTTWDLYLFPSLDGTNYADAPTTPSQVYYVGSFPLQAITTAQRVILRGVELPPGLFKVALRNNGTTQTAAATGNTLKIRSYSFQVV